MGLTAFDTVVLLFVGGSAVLGGLRGFVTEVLSVIALILVVFMLKMFHTALSHTLAPHVGTSAGAAVLAFAILAGGTYLLGRIVANAIGSRTRTSVLGPVDRALGFGFGALKGLIVASLAFLLIVLVLDTLHGGPRARPQWLTEARVYPLLKVTSASVADFVDRRRHGQPVFGHRYEQPPVPGNRD
jgi:membrane protein required for colicin V production